MYTIITGNGCPWCDKAKEALAGEPYREFNISTDPTIRTMVKAMGFKTVPQIYSPLGTHIGGYEDLENFLKEG